MLLNLAITSRRQVDDFNTVAGPPAPIPQRTEEKNEKRPPNDRRPESARSDPGIKGGGGHVNQKIATPSPTPSLTEAETVATVTAAPAERILSPSPPTLAPTAANADETAEVRVLSVAESPMHPAEREILARSRLANTPTTPFTDFPRRLDASRPSQQTATTVRHQRMYFEHAVSLVAARCATTDPRTAAAQLRSAEAADPPPGFGGPRVFYVRQMRPRPMTPLKAWSGYHGNVYFSPLRIEQAAYFDPDTQLSLPSLPACSDRLRHVLESSRLNAEHLMRLRAHADASPRQPARRRWLAGAGGGGGQSAVPVVEMDRAYLNSRGGGSVTDSRDVHLYRSSHDTGTLLFQTQQHQPQHQPQHHPQHQPQSSSRVYRGSVSRKLRDLRQALAEPPLPQRVESPVQNPRQPHHTNSLVSLDAELDRLYDRLPSLMAGVPRSQAAGRPKVRGAGAR